MTNVVFLINTLYQGGAETLVKNYALLLNKAKFNVTILCLFQLNSKYETILKDAGIQVVFLHGKWLFNPKTLFGKIINRVIYELNIDAFLINRIVHRINPDVVHAHLSVLSILRKINISRAAKYFYTVHNEPRKYWHCQTIFSTKEYEACKWLILNKKMRLIALHDNMKNELNSMFNVDDSIVVNNGIDFECFSNCSPKELLRRRLGVPENAFVVGHVGRFVPQKNHFFLLKIFAKLRKQIPNAFLLLVGSGSLLNDFKRKVAEMNLIDSVRILSDRTDIPDLMNVMDVFFFPSVYEGLGIVLIEAQKIGLRCVISNNVPPAAIISNLVTSISLDASVDIWIDSLCKNKPPVIKYKNLEGWNIRNVVKQLEKMYSE